MKNTLPGRLLSGISAATLLLLTGCATAAPDAQDGKPSPLAPYVAVLYGEEDSSQETLDAENAEVENLVSKCMAAEGFKYVPRVQPGSVTDLNSGDVDPNDPLPGTVEYAEQYGYGLAESPELLQTDQFEQDVEKYVDPNQGHVDSLSEPERKAYLETLYGVEPSEEDLNADGSYFSDWRQEGCQGQAEHQVSLKEKQRTALDDPRFADLYDALDEAYDPIYSMDNPTQEMIVLNKSWSNCMSSSGFNEFLTPNDAEDTLTEEQAALYQQPEENGEPREPNAKELQTFKNREVQVAVADATCTEKSSYDHRVQEMTHKVEKKFVSDHKKDLEALLAAYGSSK